MFTFFIFFLAFVILNMFFYTIPFIFISVTREDLIPYQVWFNVLLSLIGLLPRD